MLAQTFALAASESQRLVDDLLADGGTRRFRVHLAGPDDAASLLSLQVAADVFLGAFGNTPDLLRAEYAPLLPSMTHVVVLDSATRTAVGSLILQAAPAEELKTVVDAALPPWSMPVDRTLAALGLQRGARTGADLLLLAVRPGYRRLGLAQLLMYGGWMASLQRGIDQLDGDPRRLAALRHEPHDRRRAATDRRRGLRALPRVAGQHAGQRADEPARGRRPAAPGPGDRARGERRRGLLRGPRARPPDAPRSTPNGGEAQCLCLASAASRAICDSVICSLALRSARFSLIDLADFVEW